MTQPIRVTNLSKAFGDQVVLDGIDLHVDHGEILYVVGPSGTGKSVLSRCVLGLMAPDGGQIELDGRPIPEFGAPEWLSVRRRVAMVVQFPALLEERSVVENIALAARYGRGLRAVQADRMALDLMERLQIRHLAFTDPGDLGPGLAKAVALARALAVGASTLVLDEPTTGLDPIQAKVVDEAIVEVVRSAGLACLVISHDLEGMQKVADRALMLYQGKVHVAGTPASLASEPDPVWQQFLRGEAEGPL
ncbi:MAG: ABC transporter ATP-binding protein [Myxococcales bacterium]|nr:ABC transporter ATP-binding protein [Myxococcales bacterium]